MKRRGILGVFLVSSAFLISGINFSYTKNSVTNEEAVAPSEPGNVFYAADFATDIKNEPKYSEQKAKTFDSMSFNYTPQVYRGNSVKVAILDSGINYTHEDFGNIQGASCTLEYDSTNRKWDKYTYSSNAPKINDTLGHGTNVASVIASQINGKGVAGIAPNVELYIYKVTNSSNGYEWGAIQTAIDDCITRKIDVINMSFQAYEYDVSYNGSSMSAVSGCSTILTGRLNNAYNAGITLVGAAGNYNTDKLSYPASNNHVISVGSLARGSTSEKAGFSNTSGIDLVAPGYVTTAEKGSTNAYKETQGTSFSAPIVTAAIALYKQKNPDATPDDIETALYDSCDSISENPSWAGHGRLNIDRFLGLDEYSPQSILVNNVPDKTLELEVGEKFQLDYSVLPSSFDDGVEFTTVMDDCISVSETGLITALAEGEDYLSISPKGYPTLCDEISISVVGEREPVIETGTYTFTSKTSFTVSPDSLSGSMTASGTIQGYDTGDTGRGVQWSKNAATVKIENCPQNKTISKVTVVASSNNTTSGSATLTVGGIQFGDKITLSNKNNQSLVFEGSADSGTIILSITAGGSSTWVKSITIEYSDKSGTTPTTKTLSSITISDQKTEFAVGDIWTFGGTVTAHYSNSTTANVTSKATFEGNSTSSSGTKTVKVSYTEGSVTKDITYTITVSAPVVTNYTVTFNSNGGTGGSMTNKQTTGSTYVTPDCGFTKDGYTFDKWALNNTSGTKYAAGSTISGITANITLYATWTENSSSGGDDDIDYWTTWISQNQSALSTGGTTLLSALRTKISNVQPGSSNTLSYNDLWNAYAKTDGIPGSNGTKIYDMYGGFEFTKGTDQAGNYSKEGDKYNREHSVPKSWFNENNPAYSDIIHLVPTDGKINSYRSNYNFGEVDVVSYSYPFPARSYSGVQYQKAGITKLGSPKAINGVSTSESTVFEPDDQYKGDFARIYMYFATRYGGTTCDASTGSGGAVFMSSASNSNPYMTNYGLALVRKWHELDPVSEKERLRNNAVQDTQGNRNPFVDYPEWADKIFGTHTSTDSGTLESISLSGTYKTEFTVGDTFSYSGLIVKANYSDGTSPEVTPTSVSSPDMNTTGEKTITVKYNDGTTEKSATYKITVKSGSVTPEPEKHTTALSLDKTTASVNIGKTITLIATKTPTDSVDGITWSSSDNSVATVLNGTVTGVKAGTATITATSNDIDATCVVTVKASGSGEETTKYYSKVTSELSDWSGEYIIAYVNDSTANCWKGISGSGNMVSATISNDKITKPVDACTITVEQMTGGYSVKVNGGTNSGKYIYGTSGSNTINYGTNKSLNTFQYSGGGVKMTSNSTTFQKNSGSNELKYFKSNQTILQFFKLEDSVPDPEKTIQHIDLVCDTETVIFGQNKGSFIAPAELVATYTDESTGSITPDTSNYSINTYVLGNHTISATYGGEIYSKVIKVTNKGSSVNVGVAPGSQTENWKYSISPSTWSGYVTDNDTSSGISFSRYGGNSGDEKITLKRTNICCSNAGTFQFKNSGVNGEIYNVNNVGVISSISFSGSGDTFILYAGTSSSSCTNQINGTTSNGTYTFDLSDSNYSFFKITRSKASTTSKVSNLEVNVKHGSIIENPYSRTPVQQAEAWANYFILLTGRRGDSGPCNESTFEGRRTALQGIWNEVKNEYDFMVDGSKDAFCDTGATGIIAEAMQHYHYIVATYGLENFVIDGSNNAPKIETSNPLINLADTPTILISVISVAGIAAIGGYLFYKKRKEQ